MHPLSYDPIDGFRALFGDGTVILDGASLPLGASAVEVLNLPVGAVGDLRIAARELNPELMMFLSGPDATASALAHQALEQFWDILYRYPVYRNLRRTTDSLTSGARTYPQLLESALTKGTEDNTAMKSWLERLGDLADTFERFRQHTTTLLERAFTEVPERSASGYARRLTGYYQILDLEAQVMSDELDDIEGDEFLRTREENFREMDRRNFPHSFPIRVSYRAVQHPKKKGEYLLAEEVFFDNVETFLSLDLLRGLAAGHLPRRCEHCGRWFLLTSGYDTRYCENPAPEEPDKTCRQVGAHRKEKLLNGTVEIRKQYQRVSNRLKGQKYRGTLSQDEWNQLMKRVQDLRDDALAGRITLSELTAQYDQISMRR